LVAHLGPDGQPLAGYTYGETHPHLPLSATNALSEVTTFTYDDLHRLSTRSTPSGLLSTHSYGTNGYLSASQRGQTIYWCTIRLDHPSTWLADSN
jgi:YD repeat-containing protein